MAFSSIIFLLFFLPLTLLGYFVVRKKYRNAFLLFASLLFYFWGESVYLWVIALYIVANYSFGIAIEKARLLEKPKISKYVLIAAIGFNLGFLFFFKYISFFLVNLGLFFKLAHISIPTITPHLPLGISFFAFQGISYVVDIYRNQIVAQKSFIDFAMYKAFFAQLIAGPIVRYRDVAEQVKNRIVSTEDFAVGIQRFIIGLSKKMIFANTFASTADAVFALPAGSVAAPVAWLGVICYALQIYFDFGGYSDMAIGLGRMFGFRFLENFNYPYISQSIKEFWKRWHISLSGWFRDYLYIPLGGDRKGTVRTYSNLFVVFLLCGLWHGASFTFIIWGLWYGLFLILERIPFFKKITNIPRLIKHMYALLVVLIGWVFFRADSLSHAFAYVGSMFHGFHLHTMNVSEFFNWQLIIMILLGTFLSTPYPFKFWSKLKQKCEVKKGYFIAYNSVQVFVLLLLFLTCIILLSKNTYNPFIYYRF